MSTSTVAPIAARITPSGKLSGTVTPPGSKSYSARAVLAAGLAPGASRIRRIANSRNVRALIAAVATLGAEISYEDNDLVVVGPSELRDKQTIDVGNSGIVLRLLLGATAHLHHTTFVTTYADSLGRRSNIEMLDALRQLGVDADWQERDGRLPISTYGVGIHGGSTSIESRKSSQFLSGLLYLGGRLDSALEIHVPDELKAPAMVRTTQQVLATAGVETSASPDGLHYQVPSGTAFAPAEFSVGSDPASTAALLALAAAMDSEVSIRHTGLTELDGVVDYVRSVGATVTVGPDEIRVQGNPAALKPLDFDGSLSPDSVLPLAALSAHADGTSVFRNIEHIRYKECDRISDFRKELRKTGIESEETADSLVIHGGPSGATEHAVIDCHFDHAIVLAFTLIGARSKHGLVIENSGVVGQTYPDFFRDAAELGIDLNLSSEPVVTAGA
ncbi:3-phosphoshikimate 1-carboxyvinyltransferase [Nocardia sp. NPDC051321]|uniref:3-phosphoshikimate 1-carboxyvinyltransferase n=1 Tax=Nocardia sp. NPDC051321 TaxID=3364323 RepID=UPI0037AD8389